MDPADVFRIDVSEMSLFTVTMTDETNPVAVRIVQDEDDNGVLAAPDPAVVPGTVALPRGTFFVELRPARSPGRASYVANLSADISDVPSHAEDPDDAPSLATRIAAGSFSDYVGPFDEKDAYHFTLEAETEVSITALSVEGGRLDFRLARDANGNRVADPNEDIPIGSNWFGVLTNAFETGTSNTLMLQRGDYYLVGSPREAHLGVLYTMQLTY